MTAFPEQLIAVIGRSCRVAKESVVTGYVPTVGAAPSPAGAEAALRIAVVVRTRLLVWVFRQV